MKNGIVREDGELIFYKDDIPFHAGVVEIDGDIYYVSRHGKVVTGQHIVHKEMANGLLERGTYTYYEQGRLIEDSFIPAKRVRSSQSSSKSKKSSHGRRRKSGKFRLTKKKKIQLVCIVVAVVMLFGLAVLIDAVKSGHGSSSSAQTQSTICLPEYSEPVALCTTAGQKLYANQITMESLKGIEVYQPLRFSYGLAGEDGILSLSENADMTKSRTFILAKSENVLELHNLKTGTTYYYTVEVGEERRTGSFKTAEGTRFIQIPGVANTRDIGGYTTSSGETVKQGMIIRGTELDGLVEASYFLSGKDVEAVQEQFSFVYDMDLRYPSEVTEAKGSRLGADVGYKCYGAPMYLSAFNDSYKQAVKNIFSDLAKEENYPMYMHCTYGADRTGTIVYLLQGLLGMSEQDMVREYQMTGMHAREYATSTRMDAMAEKLSEFPGDTTAERIEHFLTKEIGITNAQIQSIRDILLED